MKLKNILPIIIALLIGAFSFAGSWTTTPTKDTTEPNLVKYSGVIDIDSGETVYSPSFQMYNAADDAYDYFLYTTTNGDSIKQTLKLQTYMFGAWHDLTTLLTNNETSASLIKGTDTLDMLTAADSLRFAYSATIYGGDTTTVKYAWQWLDSRYH